jgi:hypothetical protein
MDIAKSVGHARLTRKLQQQAAGEKSHGMQQRQLQSFKEQKTWQKARNNPEGRE